MNNLESIKERIAKLKKHAQSAENFGSKEEASAFAAKAIELLLEYNLLESDIDMNDSSDKFKSWTYSEKLSYQCKQSGQRAKLKLIDVLCKHNLCSYVWWSKLKTFEVYGQMHNVDQTIWLYNYLSIGLLRLAQKAHVTAKDNNLLVTNRYSFLKNFLIGAASGIDFQLEQQKQNNAQSSSINALMTLNKQALSEYAKKIYPTSRSSSMRDIYVGQGYEDGITAGREYSINKPIDTVKTQYIQ